MKLIEIDEEAVLQKILKEFPEAEVVAVKSKKEFLSAVSSQLSKGSFTVLCTSFKIHESADLNSKTIRYVKKGDVVNVSGVNGKWLLLTDGGYAYNNPKYIAYKEG